MKSQGNRWVIGACLASLLLLALCDTATAFRLRVRGPAVRPGPPAHAPAHGYRRKQVCGYDLVFDAGLGVYVVVGQTDVYYHEGHFYRVRGNVWEISLRADVWNPAGIDKLPPGLQVKAKSMAKVNGNGNSLVKLNGNSDGNNGKPNNNPGDSGNKPSTGAAGSGNSPLKPDNGDNKPAKSDTDTNSNKLNSNSPTKSDATGNTNKPSSRPDGNGKTKPVSKGRKK